MLDPVDAATRDLYQRQRSRKECEAAAAAVRRLLAGIEAGEAEGHMFAGHISALRRHGETIRGGGGAALLRLTVDALCRDVPLDVAGARWDVLVGVWSDLLSKGGKP